MKTSTLILTAVLAGIVALAGCRRDEAVDTTAEPAAPGAFETPPAMTPGPEDAAASVRVSDVQLGTEAGGDHTITHPLTDFTADDHTIIAAVTTTSDAGTPATGTLGARWTYQDGQLVDERSESLSFTGQDVTNFRISNPDAWAMGTYTLEITLDGEVVETREFTIQ